MFKRDALCKERFGLYERCCIDLSGIFLIKRKLEATCSRYHCRFMRGSPGWEQRGFAATQPNCPRMPAVFFLKPPAASMTHTTSLRGLWKLLGSTLTSASTTMRFQKRHDNRRRCAASNLRSFKSEIVRTLTLPTRRSYVQLNHLSIPAVNCIRRGISTACDFPPPSPIPLPDSPSIWPSIIIHTLSSRKISISTPTPNVPLQSLHDSPHKRIPLPSLPPPPHDTLHLPFLRDIPIGSVLRMTTIPRMGVRDYILQGQPSIDPMVFACTLRVLEYTKQRIVVTIKTRRRRRQAFSPLWVTNFSFSRRASV